MSSVVMMNIFMLFIALSFVFIVQSKKILVVGANGKTGLRCVNLGSKKGYGVDALTRSGILNGLDENTKPITKGIINIKGDITSKESLGNIFSKTKYDAVIFAASASKEGGNPTQIDKNGLIDIAKLCLDKKVKRLVVVSSGAVSKPWSPVYLFLNLFGGIMKAKFEGEQTLKKIYANQADCSYTIIRPGGLTIEEPLGAAGIELNQKDEVSGRISRWDVASLCIECIGSKDCANVTLECYNKDTKKPLNEVGLSNLFKKKDSESGQFLTGYERQGSTYSQLFKGLVSM